MVDLSPADRVVRKRNSNLQKQLEVTLQILGEEYRQTKERMYKEERDCGLFLQSLYSTVPGLHTYGQPDTRAMNANAMLKERRYSVMSAVSADDSEDPDDHPPTKSLAQTHQGESRGKGGRPDTPGVKNSSFESAPPRRAGPTGARAETPGQKKKKEEGSGRRPSRPSTAKSHSSVQSGPQGEARKHNSVFSPRGRFISARYGKGAYSDHELSVQGRVLHKFHHIFDPHNQPRKVNLNTLATPAVVVEGDGDHKDSTDCNNNSATAHDRNVQGDRLLQADGRTHGTRRVVWSAHPLRRPGVTSAPASAREDRTREKLAGAGRPASSQLSYAVHGGAFTARGPAGGGGRGAWLDPRVRTLALQRTFPARCADSGDESSDSSSQSEEEELADETTDQPSHLHLLTECEEQVADLESPAHSGQQQKGGQDCDQVGHSHVKFNLSNHTQQKDAPSRNVHVRLQPSCQTQRNSDHSEVKPCPSNSKAKANHVSQRRLSGDLSSANHAHTKHVPSSDTHARTVSSTPVLVRPDLANSPHVKLDLSNDTRENLDLDNHTYLKTSSSNHLQVPGDSPSLPSPMTNGAGHEASPNAGTASPLSRKPSILRPSSRLSEASEPPVELWSKLQAAGLPGRSARRPKTAPSKSELSHRSMPAPRQTVVGILAQIENQKASTRALLNSSKQLQKAVKKLVPREQLILERDFDDW